MSEPQNQPSPFSPAQRMAVPTGATLNSSVGGSATLIKNGQSLISNQLDLTQGTMQGSSAIQARWQAAQRQVQHLQQPKANSLLGT